MVGRPFRTAYGAPLEKTGLQPRSMYLGLRPQNFRAFSTGLRARTTQTIGDPMAAELRWDDAEDIGLTLSDKFPDVNPLEVRFTDLHRYVTELPTFVDDPKMSNEGKLEAIQMAWYEEYQDRNE